MDSTLLSVLDQLGFQDIHCNKIIFADCLPAMSKPGEREFFKLLKGLLEKVS